MSQQKIDLTKLNLEQLNTVKQQFSQELQHFQQSLQALLVAKNKFLECIDDIKTISAKENENQSIMMPASSSLYIPAVIKDNQMFMVDVGTGYFVDKSAQDAIIFYQKKVDKLEKESLVIQNIIKEKGISASAIDQQIRQAAVKQHEDSKRNPQSAGAA
ncbi:Gim5p KNAG_0G03600 [Huiozyma naganishii CBS 8797]|uniref:Prefoldin subunit 5 n=1 Tax=Huiozyma naganishii (strain ATCC MYA-139 / BCRC 22969 / CBS 8797 / KCTC 17520 / NBRC 10181 / NCYC 3082 / Yp74L-3) TaxID=1071383 RepID=J7S1E0_HUIN7|nr:hypothetical protein KNAG_0G03600 [Kazachstania naganishii CBS 8797]CCK71417.1 hypothetical protein KNAG_0G03600 [Kazachstania naganishii CBS 8797]